MTSVVIQHRAEEEHPASERVRPLSVGRWELLSLIVILAGFATMSFALILDRPPFGHDEAVYALRARYFAGEGSTLWYWMPYRAPGLPLLLRVAWPFGDTDTYLRAVVSLIALGGIVVTWAWTRRSFGVRAGLFAAALLAITPTYLLVGSLIYADIPSAVFGMAAVLLFLVALADAERSGTGLSRWVLLSVPVAALATLCRYGAPLLIGPAMAIVVLAYWRTVRRLFWQVAGIAAAMLVALALILLVPAVTGASEPPLLAFRDLTEPQWTSWWAPYADLVELLPEVFGPVAGLALIVGIAAVLVAAHRRDGHRRDVFIALGAVASFVVLLNLNLPFLVQNYLVPALPFLAVAAGAGLGSLTRRLPRAAVAAGLVAMLALGWWHAYPAGQEIARAQLTRSSALRDASQQLRTRFGPDCVVWTAYVVVAWYSGCSRISFVAAGDGVSPQAYIDSMKSRTGAALDEGLSCDAEVLVLLVQRGKRQPPTEHAERIAEMFIGKPIVYFGDPERVGSYKFSGGLLGTLAEVTGDPRCEPR